MQNRSGKKGRAVGRHTTVVQITRARGVSKVAGVCVAV